jgi:hypothetical protein
MKWGLRVVGVGLACLGLLLSSVSLTGTATASDLTTSDVDDATWQEIWADVGYPNTADKWRCYGTPRQLNRDPSWVIVFYRPIDTAECAGLPADPYPVLTRKQSGVWRDAVMLGPVSCSYTSKEVFREGGSWSIVKDLMRDGWCWANPMWRGYMERYLETKQCKTPLMPRPNKSVVGYIGRTEVAGKIEDGAVAWTCARPAGGAQDQYLTVFLAGPTPKQITVRLNMLQFESLKIRNGGIVVTGGLYSGSGPLCCPDQRVTVTYKMRGDKLVMVKETIEPV